MQRFPVVTERSDSHVCTIITSSSVRIDNKVENSVYSGSGTSIGNGVIITCWHIFERGCENITVYQKGMEKGQKANILALDERNDLGALLIDTNIAIGATRLADNKASRGDHVYQCGFPFRNGPVLTSGRCLGYLRGSNPVWMDTTNGSKDGDSGGGIFNANGELVGIVWGNNHEQYDDPSFGRIANRSRCSGLPEIKEFINTKCFRRPGVASPPPIATPSGPGVFPPFTPAPSFDSSLLSKLGSELNGKLDNLASRPTPVTDLSPVLTGVNDLANHVASNSNLVSPLLSAIPWLLGLSGAGAAVPIATLLLKGIGLLIGKKRSPTTSNFASGPIENRIEKFIIDRKPKIEQQYVGVPVESQQAKYLLAAMKYLAERNPGARDNLEAIKVYAKQIESGQLKVDS